MYKNISELKNKYKGEDIWIVLAGSSMNYVSDSFFENKNDLNEKINAMKKITYENSWNNINQKIIDCINEN